MKSTPSEERKPLEAPKKLVLWAYDPFQTEASLQRVFARALLQLTKNWSCRIQPVYVASGFPKQLQKKGLSNESVMEKFHTVGQGVLNALAVRLKFKELAPLVVIQAKGPEMREQVAALVDYALQEKADLLVAGTRARKGPKRWLLGSFAESLSFVSGLPLYFINPSWSVSADPKKILFPTDFSQESKYAFGRLIGFAKVNSSRITLFHQVEYPFVTNADLAYGFWPVGYNTLVPDLAIEAKDQADRWIKWAKKKGVTVTSLIAPKLASGIAESILKAASAGFGMIALAAESGKVSSALMGSVTRKIIRGSHCPVWVLRKPKETQEVETAFDITEEEVMSQLQHTEPLSTSL